MKVQPLARQASPIVKELPEETLVYDKKTDKAHCLNQTSAMVWKNCDGRTTVAEIAKRLGVHANAPVNEDIVWLALDQLEKFELLNEPVENQIRSKKLSRRNLVRTLGVAAVASVPVITSIIAPTPACAQSGPPCCDKKEDCAPFRIQVAMHVNTRTVRRDSPRLVTKQANRGRIAIYKTFRNY